MGDVAKELGRRWADAGPELKGKYEALAEKDRARYGNAKREYQISLKNGTQPVIKNGDQEDSEDECSPPNKLQNLDSCPSHEEAQSMQERIPEESAEHSSENNDTEENNSYKNANNNDSSPKNNNDDTAVDHPPSNVNETQPTTESNTESSTENKNGDAPDEEEENPEDESE